MTKGEADRPRGTGNKSRKNRDLTTARRIIFFDKNLPLYADSLPANRPGVNFSPRTFFAGIAAIIP
jgi:hypothetical protein